MYFGKRDIAKIDGKVYTINFCPGSEIVCPTFSIWYSKQIRELLDMPTLLLCISRSKTDKIQN